VWLMSSCGLWGMLFYRMRDHLWTLELVQIEERVREFNSWGLSVLYNWYSCGFWPEMPKRLESLWKCGWWFCLSSDWDLLSKSMPRCLK
jgi:hypothetical protein